jgi:hypothetical protein
MFAADIYLITLVLIFTTKATDFHPQLLRIAHTLSSLSSERQKQASPNYKLSLLRQQQRSAQVWRCCDVMATSDFLMCAAKKH